MHSTLLESKRGPLETIRTPIRAAVSEAAPSSKTFALCLGISRLRSLCQKVTHIQQQKARRLCHRPIRISVPKKKSWTIPMWFSALLPRLCLTRRNPIRILLALLRILLDSLVAWRTQWTRLFRMLISSLRPNSAPVRWPDRRASSRACNTSSLFYKCFHSH